MRTLKIAIQKSGRLHDGSLSLLKKCGIYIDNGKAQLRASSPNFPLEVYYLRNSDIPQYVEDGVVDVGIVGENLLVESQKEVITIKKLGFSSCRLSLAVPNEVEYAGLDYFQDRKIATSYPNSLQSYLAENGVQADIHKISGSVEIAPNLGLADGICDLVSSGGTLFKNGLKEVETLFRSEAVLVKTSNLQQEQQMILDQLVFRMNAVLRAKNFKYILLNVPNDKIEEVSGILPVLKSPTVLPLAQPGWSSLHSVIDETKFWSLIDKLKEAGAEDILIIPIEKMPV